MRVGIISRRFWPYCSGPEMEAADFAFGLKSVGHHSEVLTVHWEKSWPAHFLYREFEVTRIGRKLGGPWGVFRFVRELNRVISQLNLDRLIVFGLADESWAALRSLIDRYPIILRVDGSDWQSFSNRRFQFRQNRFFNRLSRIWVDTPETRVSMVRAQINADLIEVVPPQVWGDENFAVDGISESSSNAFRTESATEMAQARLSLSDAHPILDLNPKQPFVLCGSDLNDDGVRILITHWHRVLDHYPQARLWILGDGMAARKNWEHICDCQMANSIVMPGNFDDLHDVFKAANVYVHASLKGISCHRFASAMSAGASIVAFDNSFTRSWLVPNMNGLIANPSQPSSLVDGILQLLDDRRLRDSIGLNALNSSHSFLLQQRVDSLAATSGIL